MTTLSMASMASTDAASESTSSSEKRGIGGTIGAPDNGGSEGEASAGTRIAGGGNGARSAMASIDGAGSLTMSMMRGPAELLTPMCRRDKTLT